MRLISYAMNTIRLMLVAFISLVILCMPIFTLILLQSSIKKRLSTWLLSSTAATRVGLLGLPEAATEQKSSDISTAMSKPPTTVGDLKKLADDAAGFSARLDSTMQAIALVEAAWTSTKFNPDFPLGCIGMVAKIVVFRQHGLHGKAPEPSFTKEQFVSECSMVYDALDIYYTVAVKENTNENDNGPHVPRTKRGPRG